MISTFRSSIQRSAARRRVPSRYERAWLCARQNRPEPRSAHGRGGLALLPDYRLRVDLIDLGEPRP
jgi:hypothetical protein